MLCYFCVTQVYIYSSPGVLDSLQSEEMCPSNVNAEMQNPGISGRVNGEMQKRTRAASKQTSKQGSKQRKCLGRTVGVQAASVPMLFDEVQG